MNFGKKFIPKVWAIVRGNRRVKTILCLYDSFRRTARKRPVSSYYIPGRRLQRKFLFFTGSRRACFNSFVDARDPSR